MANPYDSKKVEGHVKEVAERTQEARNFFNFPENEKVIQDYGCTRKMATGRLYVTQNYVGFRAALPKVVESFAFRKVKVIEKVKLASIRIQTEDGSDYDYGGFTQREEAYAILLHLWKNVPTYTLVDVKSDVAPKSPRITENDGTMVDLTELSEDKQQAQALAGKVDTESARRGVQKMYQARDMGLATLEELDRQREVISGVQQRLYNMEYDLERGERHMRGIESIGGAIANKLTKDKSQRKQVEFQTRETKIEAVKKRDAEVDILYKFANDKLIPSLLIFKEKVFVCADATQKTKLVEKGAQWEYEDVKLVLIRARHQHLDVWFKSGGKEKRIRFMTAHVQWVVNEFSLRCGPSLDVQWEPGAKKFDYGSVELARQPPPSRDGSRGGPAVKASSLLSKGASQETRDALDEQDRYLEEMSQGLDQLHSIGKAIGTATVESTQQIKETNEHAARVQDHIVKVDTRVKKQLK